MTHVSVEVAFMLGLALAISFLFSANRVLLKLNKDINSTNNKMKVPEDALKLRPQQELVQHVLSLHQRLFPKSSGTLIYRTLYLGGIAMICVLSVLVLLTAKYH